MFKFLKREPLSYPTGNLSESQVIAKVLEYRQKGLQPICKVLGSLVLPFERKGVETPDRRLRFYSEFGAMGWFSYLIIDGHDCIDALRNTEASALVNEGKIVEPVRTPSLYERWKEVLQ